MKLTKKLLSLCLCIALTVSMSVVSFAAPSTSTPTIISGEFELISTRTYTSYLAGTLAGENLSVDRIDVQFDGVSILDDCRELDESDTSLSFISDTLYWLDSFTYFPVTVYVDGVLVGTCEVMMDNGLVYFFTVDTTIVSGQAELISIDSEKFYLTGTLAGEYLNLVRIDIKLWCCSILNNLFITDVSDTSFRFTSDIFSHYDLNTIHPITIYIDGVLVGTFEALMDQGLVDIILH